MHTIDDSQDVSSSSAKLPLAGVIVLDLSAYIAGPYGCNLLADMGATVVKIEPPEGDNLRKYPSTLPNESRAFLGVNRGKYGVCLNLKHEDGYQMLLRLVRIADVLVHNFRPAVPPRLSIDYETLKQINPQLIYCSLTGYGTTGPMANRAGYDQVLQARTGICTSQGSSEDPQIVYGSAVDFYAATLLSNGVTAALLHRERTGEGQHVGVSLLSSALAMQAARLVIAVNEPKSISRDMRSGGITGIHPTRVGHLYISANTPHFWDSLCKLIGVPELALEEKYNTVKKRALNASEIVPIIRRALLNKSAVEWENIFGEYVPCSVVRNVEDVFDDPQVHEQGLVASHEHVDIGTYHTVSQPISFGASSEPATIRSAPLLGEHTKLVMRKLGYSDQEIKTAIEEGAVKTS